MALVPQDGFAVFNESLRVYWLPVAGCRSRPPLSDVGIMPFAGCVRQVTGDMFSVTLADYTPVIEIYDGAIVPYQSPFRRKAYGEIPYNPFLVRLVCMEILISICYRILYGASLALSPVSLGGRWMQANSPFIFYGLLSGYSWSLSSR